MLSSNLLETFRPFASWTLFPSERTPTTATCSQHPLSCSSMGSSMGLWYSTLHISLLWLSRWLCCFSMVWDHSSPQLACSTIHSVHRSASRPCSGRSRSPKRSSIHCASPRIRWYLLVQAACLEVQCLCSRLEVVFYCHWCSTTCWPWAIATSSNYSGSYSSACTAKSYSCRHPPAPSSWKPHSAESILPPLQLFLDFLFHSLGQSWTPTVPVHPVIWAAWPRLEPVLAARLRLVVCLPSFWASWERRLSAPSSLQLTDLAARFSRACRYLELVASELHFDLRGLAYRLRWEDSWEAPSATAWATFVARQFLAPAPLPATS